MWNSCGDFPKWVAITVVMAEIISGEMLDGEVFDNAAAVILGVGDPSQGIRFTNNLMVYIKITSTIKITDIAMQETTRDVSIIESMTVN